MDRLNTRNSDTNTTAGSPITTKVIAVAQPSRESWTQLSLGHEPR